MVDELEDEGVATAGVDEETPEKLDLEVEIKEVSACQRHVTVTVSRTDIDRYLDKSYSEMMGTANVPGFRAGRAPRKLVEARFRSEVVDQVKGNLLVDSMEQITKTEKLAAISEPDIDPLAVEVPDEGPMTFEFDLEVRPNFDVPQWKGLKIERPVHEFGDKDVDLRLQEVLAEQGRLVPFDGAAETGDYIVTKLIFSHDGVELARSDEEVIRVRPVLSFRDGKIEDFDKLIGGAKAGDTRVGEAALTQDAPNQALRGKKVTATFEILEIKKIELPELTPNLLDELGGFESEAEMRDAILDSLKRQLDYAQQQRAREQILGALTEAADWDLPPDMLERQSHRELQRTVLELRRSGFTEDQIRASENELRQNSMAATKKSLKEHFVLERIAEDNDIEDAPEDYESEIELIAAQNGESPRRVRAQIEKGGMMDAMRNQIIERKTIEMILKDAEFNDIPYVPPGSSATAIDRTAGGGDEPDIPMAQAGGGEAEPLPEPADERE